MTAITARTWEFGSLPPGLNADEASIGVEAYDLLSFGIDRNGLSFPVHFISWGGGQNALYGYLLIPFIAFGGLNPITVRLPMLISGILAMPLVYFVGKRAWSETCGLIAMFLLAISPWHILLSRWGLESNLLPFVFLAGYCCCLMSELNNRWFLVAGLVFGLCLYAYGTAYAAVPVYLMCAVPILLLSKRVTGKHVVMSLLLFAGVAWPIGLFIVVNSLRLPTAHLGPFTMPRLPAQPRYETMAAVFSDTPLKALAQNLRGTLRLLWKQSDGLVWNTVDRYGYFYGRIAVGRVTSGMLIAPITFLGALMAVPLRGVDRKPERLLLLSWLAAAVVVGVLQPVNVNRLNLIFIPLIVFVAVFLTWLGRRVKMLMMLSLLSLLIGFIAFTRDYHADPYRGRLSGPFYSGLLPALQYGRELNDGPICITGGSSRYIFVLFVEKANPRDYLATIRYVDPGAAFREVVSLGRYTFGLQDCPTDPRTVYVIAGEQPPTTGLPYLKRCFDQYCVFSP